MEIAGWAEVLRDTRIDRSTSHDARHRDEPERTMFNADGGTRSDGMHALLAFAMVAMVPGSAGRDAAVGPLHQAAVSGGLRN